jgi:hypothetical protein
MNRTAVKVVCRYLQFFADLLSNPLEEVSVKPGHMVV